MFRLKVVSFFSAAHSLREYYGECEAVHGHNWKVEVVIEKGQLNEQGLAIDFKILKSKVNEVLDELDHKNINEIEFFKKNNPSSENIARYIYGRMSESLKQTGCKVKEVTVWEQRDYSATYYE